MFGLLFAMMVSSAAGQNQPPQMAPLPDRTIEEQAEFSFSIIATDPDVPAQNLTFSLGIGSSSGATLNATNGLFTWTPSEAAGPSTNLFSVIVTDDGSPSLTATQRFNIVVIEVNRAPIVEPISVQTINEGSLLVVSVLADDPDLPVQSLTYSLGSGAPFGMSVSSVGLLTWTPDESQGPSSNFVSVVVMDSGSPGLSTTQQFAVVVMELNSPPILQAIEDRSLNEGELLTFNIPASDSDLPAQTLTYSLGAGAPEGVTIDPASGVFTWTPSESQGPGVYQLGVIVTDDGTPASSDAQSFVVTVNEVNRAPEVGTMEDQVINVGGFLVFGVAATDGDIPQQTLTYGLGADAPAGASLSAGGLFTWAPTSAQVFTTNIISIIVSDGSLSVTQFFTATVVDANRSPTLEVIDDRIVNEGELIQFTAVGGDVNVPAQELSYALGAGAPEGAVIDPASGEFTWTPAEIHGPGVYQIGVVVTDNGTPPLGAARSFVVTVNEVNEAPTVGTIPDKEINVSGLLVFSIPATDGDIPQQTLNYSLGAGAPAGAGLSAGGLFTWTPSQQQARTTNQIKLIVSDGIVSTTQSVNVVVLEVNLAPTIVAITNRTANPGELLTFVVSAIDTNVPAQILTFALGSGAPEGATIDPLSGVFSWTPGPLSAGTTNQIGVIVTDNGLPPLSAAQSFIVVVSGSSLVPPQLLNPLFNANTFSASVNSLSGRTYFFERNHSGVSSGWQLLGQFPGTGGMITLTDPTATNANTIYRARVE